jgi:2-polyprenylphenol 6-hydroxylase
MSTNFDIAIVGGGMVGLAMAAALAQSDLKILLIEKNHLSAQLGTQLLDNKPVEDGEFDVRVSAISPANRELLSRLQVWQFIPTERLADYQRMSVWDGDGTGEINFSAAQIAQPNLGVIVENRVLQAALLKRIESFGNIHCCFGEELELLDCLDKHIEITLSDGQHFKSQLVIGADGANSLVREKAGIESKQSDYQQTAFVMNVKTQYSHNNTAWQRFTATGPVAFLPLANDHLCSIVWSIDKDKAQPLIDLGADAFVEKLEQAFESKLGEVSAVSKHFGFPLIKRHSSRYLDKRIALIGDAAHTIHPLAGQGVNLGFQDVDCLAKTIMRLQRQGRDFSLLQNLRPFERERKTENLVMQNAMSGFKHLFSNQSMPITLLRNFAMSALDKVPMAKEMIIKKAMGI